MRITESRLRQVVREVLLENMRLDVYKEGIKLRRDASTSFINLKKTVAEFNGSLGKNPITGENKEEYEVKKFDETKLPLIENLENKQIALNNDGAGTRGLFLKEKDEFFFIKFSDLDTLYFVRDSLLDTAIIKYMNSKKIEPAQQKIIEYSKMFKTEKLKTESDMYKLIDMLVKKGFRPKNENLTF